MQHAEAGLLDLVGQPAPQVDLSVDGPAAAGQARQQRPAQHRGDDHGQEQQQGAGGQRQQQVGQEGLGPGHAGAHQVQPARIDPVDQHETREDGHEEQGRDQRAAHRVGQSVEPAPGGVAGGTGRQFGRTRLRVVAGRRPRPDLPGRDARPAGQRRQPFEAGALRHRHAALDHRVGTDVGVVRQRDRRHLPHATLNREILQVHGGADADAVAHRQQVRRAHGDAVDGGIAADPRAQRAQVPGLERRTGQQMRRRDVQDPVHQPPAIELPPVERIAARLETPEDGPLAGHHHAEAQQIAGQVASDGQGYRAPDGIPFVTRPIVVSEERRQPDQHAHADQQRQGGQLRQAAGPAPPLRRLRRRRLGRGLRVLRDRQRIHPLRQRPQRRVLVELVHRQQGVARMLAQRRHQPRGQQRMAAQVAKEIAGQAQGLAGEQGA
ncbi:hypothetical protein D9M68_587620 [compost metagenome]